MGGSRKIYSLLFGGSYWFYIYSNNGAPFSVHWLLRSPIELVLREHSLELLCGLPKVNNMAWVVWGNFNEIMVRDDKLGDNLHPRYHMVSFRETSKFVSLEKYLSWVIRLLRIIGLIRLMWRPNWIVDFQTWSLFLQRPKAFARHFYAQHLTIEP